MTAKRFLLALTLGLTGCELLLNDKFSGGAVTIPSVADASPDSSSSPLLDAGTDAAISKEDPYPAAVRADAPQSWWRFEEPTGTTFKDEMGHHDLMIPSPKQVHFQQPGAMKGFSVQIDGDTNFVMAGTFDFSKIQVFTIEVWIHPLTKNDVYEHIFEKITSNDTGPVDGAYLYYNGANPSIAFERWKGSQPSDYRRWSHSADLKRFTHVVASYGVSETALYIDGVLAPDDGERKSSLVADPDVPVLVGVLFNGYLDELAFYDDKALTAQQVKAHFDAAQLTPP